MPCAECGYDPAFHAFERWSLRIDVLTDPFLRPFGFLNSALTRISAPIIDAVAYPLAKTLTALGLGHIRHVADHQDSESAQVLWEEANKRGITMYQFCLFHLRRRLFMASYGGKRISFEGLPRTNRRIASLSWVDDKLELKKRFHHAGFPVAKGGTASSLKQAVALFQELSKPVIAKPRIGSGGRIITL